MFSKMFPIQQVKSILEIPELDRSFDHTIMNRLHEIDKKTYKQVAEVWRTAARPVFSGNINPLVNTLNL